MRARLALPFVLTGFAGLVYETAWSRLLRLAFGSTTAAVATVLAAFMTGLALGSLLGGRLADRLAPRRALRLFAHLELGVAAFSLLSVFFLERFPETYAALELSWLGGRAARGLSAGLLLVPPTLLMGATLPLLARAALALGESAASTVAWLYAVNTAGAVAGAAATGFVLLPALGVRRSILLAAALDVAAAWLVYRLARRVPEEAAAAPRAAGEPGGRGSALLLASAAASGLVALGLEVLWFRTLVLTVGSSTQAFALMLATFLGGIALGSFLYGRLAPRLAADARVAAGLQVGIAALSVLLLHLATVLPYTYLALWERLPEGAPGLVIGRLLPAVLLMLGPTLLMGMNLPALVRARGEGRALVGANVGAVLGANTLGAILGSLLVGLVALPALGVVGATSALAACGLLGAGLALLAARRAGRPVGALLGALALAALLLGATPRWDPRVMARGLVYLAPTAADFKRQGRLRQAMEEVRLVHHAEGVESSVLVYDGGAGTIRHFVVNGRHEATSSPNDMRNQYLLGHLPALLHQGPVREGLVIALGSGMTAGTLARHAERVTVVELEPGVRGAAAAFAAWNHDVMSDPKVRVVIDDGRHFLLTTKALFDVITVDPIHPSVAGSELLYSVEQYRLVRRRLAPGGVAAQWLPLYQMGLEDARSIAASFHAVFPGAQVWINGADAILIGGGGERLPTAVELRDALARPEVAASLAVVRQGRLGTFLAGHAIGPPDVARYVAGARLSRDDRPVVEFSLPWQTFRDTVDRNLLEILRFASGPPPFDLAGLEPAELEQIERSRAALDFDQLALALRLVKHESKMRSIFEQALRLDPDDALARQALGE